MVRSMCVVFFLVSWFVSCLKWPRSKEPCMDLLYVKRFRCAVCLHFLIVAIKTHTLAKQFGILSHNDISMSF